MTNIFNLLLAYDFDQWHGYGEKAPVEIDISTKINSHIILCGMSGIRKSYALNILFARLCESFEAEASFYFADFKQDDQFSNLRGCEKYYPYDRTIEALETVNEILHKK